MGMVVDSISYHKIGSPPDVDTDFPESVRDAIYYDYLVGEWGRENVAHVTTLGTIQAKKAIDAAAKNYRISVAEATAAKKLLPDKMEGTLADLLASNSEVSAQFDRLKERNPRWEDALKAAVQLEGHVNQYGVHAGAVIISNDSLVRILLRSLRATWMMSACIVRFSSPLTRLACSSLVRRTRCVNCYA